MHPQENQARWQHGTSADEHETLGFIIHGGRIEFGIEQSVENSGQRINECVESENFTVLVRFHQLASDGSQNDCGRSKQHSKS